VNGSGGAAPIVPPVACGVVGCIDDGGDDAPPDGDDSCPVSRARNVCTTRAASAFFR
jgi:hypothetical protein